MIFVSTRKHLDNEDKLGATSFWDIQIKDQVEVGEGEQGQRNPLELADVREALAGKSVLLLVHGYNNEFADIVRAYDIIDSKVQQHLSDYYDEVVGVTWPGGDTAIDWYAPKQRAGVVGPRLAKFIENISDDVGTIDVMSHSLGARVALSALNLLAVDSVRAHFLTASAVDNEVIEPQQKYFSAVRFGATESVLLHSKNDFVLKSAYRLAEWDNPLGLFGPENPAAVIEHLPNVTVGNCKNVIYEHGGYKGADQIYRFLDQWMQGNIDTQFTTV